MLFKSNYARILFFIIIYVGVNLLIVKIKSSDYIYNNMFKIIKNRTIGTPMNNSDIQIKKDLFSTVSLTAKFDICAKINERTKQIFETCKENNLTTLAVKRNFLYSLKHSGLYCWIRKAGSTTFTKFFSDMNNRLVAKNFYREIKFLSPKSDKLLDDLINNDNVFKFLIVRHPFERLVSAYRDRIEDNSRYTAQSWIYASQIFHLTRPELFESIGTIDTHLLKIFYEDKRLKLVPTFKEFVRWLLQQDSSNDDPHWNQYYRHCALCSVPYDFILKLDNYTNSDIDYIFTKMNLHKKEISLTQLGETRKGRTNFDQTCNYFKNLSHEAVVSLYEKYRIDFDMFNYEFDKYFECTEGD